MKKVTIKNGIALPRKLTWSVEDWEDFYFTLRNFKLRVLKRHGFDLNTKPRQRRPKCGI